MTEIPIPTGPTNREIIDRSYQVLGMSDAMFGLTEEEYAAAVLPLGGMAREWPYSELGFIIEDEAGLRPEEESGISRAYLETVAYGLAERIGPTVGKTLSSEARKAKSGLYSRLCGDVATPPTGQYADATIRGAGARCRPVFFPRA